MSRTIFRTFSAATIAGALTIGSAVIVADHASAQTTTPTTAASTRKQPQSRKVTLSGLVAPGTITQAQADAIYSAITAASARRSTGTSPAPSTTTLANREAARRAKYGTIVSPLVANKTITQAQADAVVSALATRPDVAGSTTAKSNGSGRKAGKASTGKSGSRRSGRGSATATKRSAS